MKHIGNLTYPDGARSSKKRIGRGQGSGYGGTSTKGHKGQKSRSGFHLALGFEGGQMPLNRRLPKFGFNSPNRKVYQVINLSRIQELVETKKIEDKIDFETLYKIGVLSKKNVPLKILGDGDLKIAVNISAHKFTKSAIQKIESAGGTVTING